MTVSTQISEQRVVTARPCAAARRAGQGGPHAFIGDDPAIMQVRQMLERVAATDASVLVTGETGTGKEIVAREIHQQSARAGAPFVAVNCGAINESLQESELFGHVAGAFTGATGRKRGIFETADGGTVFLDEVGETSHGLQVRLLRTLQSGEFSPVGSAERRFCNVRVVAATNRDLKEAVQCREFRADLYYRLNVIRVQLPPMRERRGDILPLARHFLDVYARAYDRGDAAISQELEGFLLRYDFPGNVRELENIIHRSVVLGRGASYPIDSLLSEIDDGPACEQSPTSDASAASQDEGALLDTEFVQAKAQIVERFERDYITRVLRESGGIVRRAAKRAGLSERNFHEKLRRYGIQGQSFRG